MRGSGAYRRALEEEVERVLTDGDLLGGSRDGIVLGQELELLLKLAHELVLELVPQLVLAVCVGAVADGNRVGGVGGRADGSIRES